MKRSLLLILLLLCGLYLILTITMKGDVLNEEVLEEADPLWLEDLSGYPYGFDIGM